MLSYRLQHKDNTIAIVDFEEGAEHPVFREILDIFTSSNCTARS